MFKVNNKDTRTTPGVILMSLLLTLNIFHFLLYCFYSFSTDYLFDLDKYVVLHGIFFKITKIFLVDMKADMKSKLSLRITYFSVGE